MDNPNKIEIDKAEHERLLEIENSFNSEVLTQKQAAKYLQTSERTLERYRHAKIIPFVKVAGKILFSKKALEEWLKGEYEQEDFKIKLIK